MTPGIFHQDFPGEVRIIPADTDRADQILVLRMFQHKGEDAFPQEIERQVFLLIFLDDKGPPKFNALG
jgi:hypothetical protein